MRAGETSRLLAYLFARAGRGGCHALRDRRFAEDAAADVAAAREVAAGLRALRVDRAEQGGGIEGDAGAVAALVHAAGAVMLRDVFLGHVIARAQLHHEVAAAAAAGARGKVGMRVDAGTRAGCAAGSDAGVGR